MHPALIVAGRILHAVVVGVGTVGGAIAANRHDDDTNNDYSYSYRDIRKMSDDEWKTNRERVRKEYCNSGDDINKAERLEKTLNRFDDVYYERQPKTESDPSYRWTDANRWDRD